MDQVGPDVAVIDEPSEVFRGKPDIGGHLEFVILTLESIAGAEHSGHDRRRRGAHGAFVCNGSIEHHARARDGNGRGGGEPLGLLMPQLSSQRLDGHEVDVDLSQPDTLQGQSVRGRHAHGVLGERRGVPTANRDLLVLIQTDDVQLQLLAKELS